MNRANELHVLSWSTRADGLLTVVKGRCSGRVCVLHLRGALQTPVNGELEQHVRALLGRGVRVIILDLTLMSRIDAAGIGSLVRAYNIAIAADGVLRVIHPAKWVGQILDRAGLLEMLNHDLESFPCDFPGASLWDHTAAAPLRR